MKMRIVVDGVDRFEREGFSKHALLEVYISEGDEVYVIRSARKWEKRRVWVAAVRHGIDRFTTNFKKGEVEVVVE